MTHSPSTPGSRANPVTFVASKGLYGAVTNSRNEVKTPSDVEFIVRYASYNEGAWLRYLSPESPESSDTYVEFTSYNKDFPSAQSRQQEEKGFKMMTDSIFTPSPMGYRDIFVVSMSLFSATQNIRKHVISPSDRELIRRLGLHYKRKGVWAPSLDSNGKSVALKWDDSNDSEDPESDQSNVSEDSPICPQRQKGTPSDFGAETNGTLTSTSAHNASSGDALPGHVSQKSEPTSQDTVARASTSPNDYAHTSHDSQQPQQGTQPTDIPDTGDSTWDESSIIRHESDQSLPADLRDLIKTYKDANCSVLKGLIKWGGFNYEYTGGFIDQMEFMSKRGTAHSMIVRREQMKDHNGSDITIPYIAADHYEHLLDSMFRPRTDITKAELQAKLREIRDQLEVAISGRSKVFEWHLLLPTGDARVARQDDHAFLLETLRALRSRMDHYLS